MIPRRTRAMPIAASTLLTAALAGCATTGDRGQPLVPSQYQTRTGPYVVFTNQPLPADDGVVRQLTSLRSELEETLGLKVDAGEHPVEVYILGDRKAFEHFLTFYYPDLPQRRAFFIAQGPRRVVYTFQGDRLEEDLRHEATHALLHLAVGDVPLWLDEGLAEYFESADPAGVNREHMARIPQDLRDGWTPDLARLEGLKAVRQMAPRDYREAWAWVHYLLQASGDGRAALLSYLGDLRGRAGAKPLSIRLPVPAAEASIALQSHLRTVRPAEPTRVASAESTVRLQDAPIEVEPIAAPNQSPRRRGFFGRLLGRILP